MPNQVYNRAHEGLSNMVSARAATRVLQDTLRSRGATPDTVDAELMSELLLGPVLKEFEQILPREGLKRNLSNLADELDTANERPGTSSQANNPSRLESIRNFLQTPILGGERSEDDTIPAEASSTPQTARRPEPSPKDTLEIPPEEIKSPTRTPPPPSRVTPSADKPSPRAAPRPQQRERKAAPLSDEQLEKIALRFAQIEHVKIVAAIRENGDIAVSRGSGIDIDALSRYGLMGLRLLRRSGKLNSYYLAHTQGQLFLLTFGRETLILVGRSELNVGTVFATAVTLKEEL